MLSKVIYGLCIPYQLTSSAILLRSVQSPGRVALSRSCLSLVLWNKLYISTRQVSGYRIRPVLFPCWLTCFSSLGFTDPINRSFPVIASPPIWPGLTLTDILGLDWADINLSSFSLSAPSDSRFNLWLLLDRRRRWRCSTKFMGLKFSRVRRKISISAGKKLRMFEASANNRDWITVNYTQTANQSESSPASRENIRTNESRVSDLSDWETRSDGQDGQRVMMEQLLMCQTQSRLVSPVELPTSRHHLYNWDSSVILVNHYKIGILPSNVYQRRIHFLPTGRLSKPRYNIYII